MRPIAIVDIETAPDLEAVARCTPPFHPDPPRRGRGREERDAGKAEEEYWRLARQRAMLKPETSRIVAIGLHFPHEEPVLWAEEDEAKLLSWFWRDWCGCPHAFAFYSGNNGRGAFDVRHLIVRSWANGIEVPEDALELSVRGRWIDLAERFLVGSEAHSFCGANSAAKVLGLIGRDLGWAVVRDKDTLPVKAVTFHEALATDLAAAWDYLRNDLAIERAIADVILGKEAA